MEHVSVTNNEFPQDSLKQHRKLDLILNTTAGGVLGGCNRSLKQPVLTFSVYVNTHITKVTAGTKDQGAKIV